MNAAIRLAILFLMMLGQQLSAQTTADSQATGPAYEGGSTDTGPQYAKPKPKAATKPQGPWRPVDLAQGSVEERIAKLLATMTLEEKIGQLHQVTTVGDKVSPELAEEVRNGQVGSVFYTGKAELVKEVQRIATEESRLGLPLLLPRDVIHGFRTVMPIPLGQAATWNPELVEAACAVAAREARQEGVNWTFAPMLDVSRDPRWGRIAESFGEDPVLCTELARASVLGYQGAGPEVAADRIVACAKHYVAYGLSEGGRDYNQTMVAVSELHNAYLPSFHAAINAGCWTVMTGFNSLNGTPATGNRHTVRKILKEQWQFPGLVVSDWGSIIEMIAHGYCRDERDAGLRAFQAGVDMEMASTTYRTYMAELIENKKISPKLLDDAVARIIRVKLHVAPTPADVKPSGPPDDAAREIARSIARQSIVLLKNDSQTLPLDARKLKQVAVIGPLADAQRDQLGCWTLDGKAEESITPLAGLKEALSGKAEVKFVKALESSVDEQGAGIDDAVKAAAASDAIIACIGEEWWLSGEASSRASLDLPGAQAKLVRKLAATGKPLILVVIAGRPLTIGAEVAAADAVCYAWHPGTMGGPAIADILLGKESPSGRLPVTIPKHVGQVPLYYSHTSTGRPPVANLRPPIGAGLLDYQNGQKYTSHYLDTDPFPLFPFGFGLTYSKFAYEGLELSTARLSAGQTLAVRAKLTNIGDVTATEVAQLYVHDVVAKIVRPVRELKAFRRITLEPGESTVVEFALNAEQLSYVNNAGVRVLEPGLFEVGIGGDSTVKLDGKFRVAGPLGLANKRPPRTAKAD